jgi:hypothetical protein
MCRKGNELAAGQLLLGLLDQVQRSVLLDADRQRLIFPRVFV